MALKRTYFWMERDYQKLSNVYSKGRNGVVLDDNYDTPEKALRALEEFLDPETESMGFVLSVSFNG